MDDHAVVARDELNDLADCGGVFVAGDHNGAGPYLGRVERNAEDGDPGRRQAARAAGRRPEEFLSGRLSAGLVAW